MIKEIKKGKCRCVGKCRCKRKWRVVVELGRDNNKRKQKTVIVTGSNKDAQNAEAELLVKIRKGLYLEPCKTTLGEYFDQWFETIQEDPRKKTRKRTLIVYKYHIKCIKKTNICNLPLSKLTPLGVQKAVNALPGHLSPRTIKDVIKTLKAALKKAVEWELLARNPAADLEKPDNDNNEDEEEKQIWTEKETAAFLATSHDSKYYEVFFTDTTSGLRIGELTALTWDDIDLKAGYLVVSKTLLGTAGGVPEFGPPKTASSKRKVFLDQETIELLKNLKKKQLEQRLKSGGKWQHHNLVFCKNNGCPRSFMAYNIAFHKLIAKVGLPDINIHTLRHIHATFLYNQDVDLYVIADRLGHSKKSGPEKELAGLAMTLRYAHITDEKRMTAVDAITKALSKGRRELIEESRGTWFSDQGDQMVIR